MFFRSRYPRNYYADNMTAPRRKLQGLEEELRENEGFTHCHSTRGIRIPYLEQFKEQFEAQKEGVEE